MVDIDLIAWAHDCAFYNHLSIPEGYQYLTRALRACCPMALQERRSLCSLHCSKTSSRRRETAVNAKELVVCGCTSVI
jgi:hypothetical protein